MLNNILDSGGLLCGGFVRDRLILGEKPNDIDFYFNGKTPQPFQSWDSNGAAKEKIFMGTKYHCIEPVKLSENTDLTCNIFSFNGRELVARPTHNCYSYFKSWELLLKKRFVFTNKKEIRIKLKMLAKGWTQETHDFRRQTEPIAPPFGPWSDFTLAKERFDSLAL